NLYSVQCEWHFIAVSFIDRRLSLGATRGIIAVKALMALSPTPGDLTTLENTNHNDYRQPALR
ncbi:hypothetical protein, partial [Pyrobaculum aerophilum]|uniref:hypothetical protein n=1 Tax=Pyrobaculum aerophilum TaxID=13773 RepID=UPI0023F0624C